MPAPVLLTPAEATDYLNRLAALSPIGGGARRNSDTTEFYALDDGRGGRRIIPIIYDYNDGRYSDNILRPMHEGVIPAHYRDATLRREVNRHLLEMLTEAERFTGGRSLTRGLAIRLQPEGMTTGGMGIHISPDDLALLTEAVRSGDATRIREARAHIGSSFAHEHTHTVRGEDFGTNQTSFEIPTHVVQYLFNPQDNAQFRRNLETFFDSHIRDNTLAQMGTQANHYPRETYMAMLLVADEVQKLSPEFRTLWENDTSPNRRDSLLRMSEFITDDVRARLSTTLVEPILTQGPGALSAAALMERANAVYSAREMHTGNGYVPLRLPTLDAVPDDVQRAVSRGAGMPDAELRANNNAHFNRALEYAPERLRGMMEVASRTRSSPLTQALFLQTYLDTLRDPSNPSRYRQPSDPGMPEALRQSFAALDNDIHATNTQALERRYTALEEHVKAYSSNPAVALARAAVAGPDAPNQATPRTSQALSTLTRESDRVQLVEDRVRGRNTATRYIGIVLPTEQSLELQRALTEAGAMPRRSTEMDGNTSFIVLDDARSRAVLGNAVGNATSRTPMSPNDFDDHAGHIARSRRGPLPPSHPVVVPPPPAIETAPRPVAPVVPRTTPTIPPAPPVPSGDGVMPPPPARVGPIPDAVTAAEARFRAMNGGIDTAPVVGPTRPAVPPAPAAVVPTPPVPRPVAVPPAPPPAPSRVGPAPDAAAAEARALAATGGIDTAPVARFTPTREHLTLLDNARAALTGRVAPDSAAWRSLIKLQNVVEGVGGIFTTQDGVNITAALQTVQESIYDPAQQAAIEATRTGIGALASEVLRSQTPPRVAPPAPAPDAPTRPPGGGAGLPRRQGGGPGSQQRFNRVPEDGPGSEGFDESNPRVGGGRARPAVVPPPAPDAAAPPVVTPADPAALAQNIRNGRNANGIFLLDMGGGNRGLGVLLPAAEAQALRTQLESHGIRMTPSVPQADGRVAFVVNSESYRPLLNLLPEPLSNAIGRQDLMNLRQNAIRPGEQNRVSFQGVVDGTQTPPPAPPEIARPTPRVVDAPPRVAAPPVAPLTMQELANEPRRVARVDLGNGRTGIALVLPGQQATQLHAALTQAGANPAAIVDMGNNGMIIVPPEGVARARGALGAAVRTSLDARPPVAVAAFEQAGRAVSVPPAVGDLIQPAPRGTPNPDGPLGVDPSRGEYGGVPNPNLTAPRPSIFEQLAELARRGGVPADQPPVVTPPAPDAAAPPVPPPVVSPPAPDGAAPTPPVPAADAALAARQQAFIEQGMALQRLAQNSPEALARLGLTPEQIQRFTTDPRTPQEVAAYLTNMEQVGSSLRTNDNLQALQTLVDTEVTRARTAMPGPTGPAAVARNAWAAARRAGGTHIDSHAGFGLAGVALGLPDMIREPGVLNTSLTVTGLSQVAGQVLTPIADAAAARASPLAAARAAAAAEAAAAARAAAVAETAAASEAARAAAAARASALAGTPAPPPTTMQRWATWLNRAGAVANPLSVVAGGYQWHAAGAVDANGQRVIRSDENFYLQRGTAATGMAVGAHGTAGVIAQAAGRTAPLAGTAAASTVGVGLFAYAAGDYLQSKVTGEGFLEALERTAVAREEAVSANDAMMRRLTPGRMNNGIPDALPPMPADYVQLTAVTRRMERFGLGRSEDLLRLPPEQLTAQIQRYREHLTADFDRTHRPHLERFAPSRPTPRSQTGGLGEPHAGIGYLASAAGLDRGAVERFNAANVAQEALIQDLAQAESAVRELNGGRAAGGRLIGTVDGVNSFAGRMQAQRDLAQLDPELATALHTIGPLYRKRVAGGTLTPAETQAFAQAVDRLQDAQLRDMQQKVAGGMSVDDYFRQQRERLAAVGLAGTPLGDTLLIQNPASFERAVVSHNLRGAREIAVTGRTELQPIDVRADFGYVPPAMIELLKSDMRMVQEPGRPRMLEVDVRPGSDMPQRLAGLGIRVEALPGNRIAVPFEEFQTNLGRMTGRIAELEAGMRTQYTGQTTLAAQAAAGRMDDFTVARLQQRAAEAGYQLAGTPAWSPSEQAFHIVLRQGPNASGEAREIVLHAHVSGDQFDIRRVEDRHTATAERPAMPGTFVTPATPLSFNPNQAGSLAAAGGTIAQARQAAAAAAVSEAQTPLSAGARWLTSQQIEQRGRALADALATGSEPAQVAALVGRVGERETSDNERLGIINWARGMLEQRNPRPAMAIAMIDFLTPADPRSVSGSNASLPHQMVSRDRGIGN